MYGRSTAHRPTRTAPTTAIPTRPSRRLRDAASRSPRVRGGATAADAGALPSKAGIRIDGSVSGRSSTPGAEALAGRAEAGAEPGAGAGAAAAAGAASAFSIEIHSGAPSGQTSVSAGRRPSRLQASSVARSTGPYSVPSGR